MGGLQNTFYFIVFLGVLVTVHELGHFLAAKWAGVKVLKFSIGFGPPIFKFARGETEYQVAWIPLGGYVRMAGELPGDDVEPEDLKRSFTQAPWWKRAIIVAAGPTFNLIFPILAYFFAFVGDHQAVAPRVAWVDPDLPAATAGLRPGDLITRVDGEDIREFGEISRALQGVFDRPIPVTVKRDGQDVTVTIVPKMTVDSTPVEKVRRGLLGISYVARPAVVGVPPGSEAEKAGLTTFDRILSIDGKPVGNELQLEALLEDRAVGDELHVTVVRSQLNDVGGVGVVFPQLVELTVPRQAGDGFDALGAESGDLYVWTVFPGSPAEKAGLERGDRLVSVNGTQLMTYFSWTQQLQAVEKEEFSLTWKHGGSEQTKKLSQVALTEEDDLKNRLEVLEFGVRPRLAFQGVGDLFAAGPAPEIITVTLGPVDALRASLRTVPDAVRTIGLVMAKLFTREIPLDSVGGPIMLFQVAAKSAEAGYEVFLKNMALVSVNLGLVNLLPIPVLDGFGLLAALWEGIRRRPIPMRAREIANYVGLVMLALLVVLVFKNDITRLLR